MFRREGGAAHPPPKMWQGGGRGGGAPVPKKPTFKTPFIYMSHTHLITIDRYSVYSHKFTGEFVQGKGVILNKVYTS